MKGVYIMLPNKTTASRKTTLMIATGGLLAAASVILRFLELSLPFLFPSFLKIDVSNVPALIGAFAMGPFVGAAILLIKNIVYLPFTTTGGVGELADFIVSLTLVLPAALIYRYNKSLKGAVIGMALG